MQIDDLKENLALQMMRDGGFDPENRGESPLEWDLDREDSQYSICKDIASDHVDFILTQIMSFPTQEAEEEANNGDFLEFGFEDEKEKTSFLDEHGNIRREKTNTTSACLFIFMDAGGGNPIYVKDVRQWLANVDAAGIPDNTEIEGQLYLDYDIKGPIETIECGECGRKDIIVSNHEH